MTEVNRAMYQQKSPQGAVRDGRARHWEDPIGSVRDCTECGLGFVSEHGPGVKLDNPVCYRCKRTKIFNRNMQLLAEQGY
jgi:hypothetical protein